MRKNLRCFSLMLGTIVLTTLAQSQDYFVYAITDIQKDGASWSYLRKLDLKNGVFSDILLNGADVKQVVYDASSKNQIENFTPAAKYGFSTQPAFSSGVAAIAFDKKNNRLWYTPMFIDQLRYIDLRSMKVFFVTDKAFTGMPVKSSDQGNIITRMTMGDDGYGYAMTNDGMHLLRFSTNKNISIEDLGALADAQENKGISIHNSCSSFGGDMIADNDGNLFVISARNQVYKVNIETKVATRVGAISGLPANFTVNGAAVNDNNQIIVSSAVTETAYYIVDPKTWNATAFKASGTIWRSSDLANSNILKVKTSIEDIPTLSLPLDMGSNKIQVYPNPVSNDEFTIQFSQIDAGKYTLQVTDVMGHQVIQRIINISNEEQTEQIKLNPAAAKGIYLVKVVNQNNVALFSKKIIVQ